MNAQRHETLETTRVYLPIISRKDLHQMREEEILKYHIPNISLDGNIACIVNDMEGALRTMNLLKYHGGEPANLLLVGYGTTQEKITEVFKILLQDPSIQGIFINMDEDGTNSITIARGLVAAAQKIKINMPIVVRMTGASAELGLEIIKKSNLYAFVVMEIDEAVESIIQLAN